MNSHSHINNGTDGKGIIKLFLVQSVWEKYLFIACLFQLQQEVPGLLWRQGRGDWHQLGLVKMHSETLVKSEGRVQL